MKLDGQLQEIIYQNETNSYTIATFTTEEEEFTVVGYLPFINEGDFLELDGKFVTHQDYGRQFKIDTFEKKILFAMNTLLLSTFILTMPSESISHIYERIISFSI